MENTEKYTSKLLSRSCNPEIELILCVCLCVYFQIIHTHFKISMSSKSEINKKSKSTSLLSQYLLSHFPGLAIVYNLLCILEIHFLPLSSHSPLPSIYKTKMELICVIFINLIMFA